MATAVAPAFQTREPYLEERLPESDGKPMAETDVHRDQMVDLLDALKEHFRPSPDIYVTGNIFLYYRNEAGERKSVSPDIFVVRGVEKKDRRYYNLEIEKKAPDLVVELISTDTKVEDFGNKRVIYAGLGVHEYFLFDPTGEALKERLRGFRLDDGDYSPMMGARLHSETLGLDLVVEQGRLRLFDPKNRRYLFTHQESEAARRNAETKAAAAEEENARLREELVKLRGSTA